MEIGLFLLYFVTIRSFLYNFYNICNLCKKVNKIHFPLFIYYIYILSNELHLPVGFLGDADADDLDYIKFKFLYVLVYI